MPKRIQYLSKRRRNQLINHEICHHGYLNRLQLHNNISTVVPNVIEERNTISVPNIVEERNTLQSTSVHNAVEQRTVDSTETLQNTLDAIVDTSTILDIEECDILGEIYDEGTDNELQYYSELPNILTDILCNNNALWQDIQTLIVEHCISHHTANQLLRILRQHGHLELPKDVRMLIRTPRNACTNIKLIGNGRYIHFGISSGLKRSMKIYFNFLKGNEIKLNINIDGVPISKSSGSRYWHPLQELMLIRHHS